MATIKRARTLNDGEFTRLIKITRATVRYPDRDVLVLMFGHHVGLRVTETSRITVADVIQANGKIRSEMSLRAAVTKGCRQRCAYLVTKPLLAALEAYISYRIERDIGMELVTSKYRGLIPNQPLVFSGRGAALSQNTKRRILASGERKDFKACDSLQSHLTKLYKKAGLDASSHSGRRSFATRVLAKSGSLEVVATLLGHASADDVSSRYCDVSQDTLREMFAAAI